MASSPTWRRLETARLEYVKAPLWVKTVKGQQREVAWEFEYSGLEYTMEGRSSGESDDSDATTTKKKKRKKKRRRRWCLPRKSSKEPLEDAPWKWEKAEAPVRHEWWWPDPDGAPRCDVREDWWAETHEVIWDPSEETNLVMKHIGGVGKWLLNFVDTCAGGAMGHAEQLKRDELEAALSRLEWYPLYRLFPIKVPENLELLLQRISHDSFRQYDGVHGGNCMWHAARRGDTLTCRRLINLGFGSLVREISNVDGRTAFEVALFSGFPDTAFLLEPYARIRNLRQKKSMDDLLLGELTFVANSGDTRPERKPEKRTGIFAKLPSFLSIPSSRQL